MVPIVEESDLLREDQHATASVPQTIEHSTHNETGGKWLIQVGAFAKEKTAHIYMQKLQKKYATLANAKAVLTSVSKDNGVIFRARFTGLTSPDARKTCTALKNNGKQCIMLSGDI